jgi:methylated-DNA-[protein]-cysteine S-methyltransferase
MISLYTKNIKGVWFGVAYDKEEVFATTFAFSEKRTLQGLLESVPFNIPFQHLEKPSVFAEHALGLLRNIYDGKDVSHSFSLATEHLSNYARKVIETVSLIPLGYVTSYGSVARAAGGSPRAVGRVMALNPFAPVVPCHRVVSSDFTLGGYGGGLDVKLDFLKREKRGYTAKREIPVNGKKLQVFPAEFVLRKVGKE